MDERIEKRFADVSKSGTFGNIVRTYALDTKSVLDIGCSYGEFLAHFGSGSVGISINKDELAYGKLKGLDIRFGNIESDELELTEKFDAIFANNIFEHLYSPHSFLIKIKELLKPDGILILGVPCIPKFVFLLHFKKFRGSLASAHINFFIRDTLIKTTEVAGWNIMAARGFHFSNPIVDHMFDSVYPHFYIVARVDPHFSYSVKRQNELAGYSE